MTQRTFDTTMAAVAAAAGILLVGIAFDPVHPTGEGPLWSRVLMVAVGWSFVFAGLIGRRLRKENRTGNIMVAIGWLWWLSLLIGTRVPVVWSLSSALQSSSVVLLVYLLLTFPQERLRDSRWSQLIMAVTAGAFALGVLFSMFYDPRAFGCPNCPKGLNVFLVRNDFNLIALKDKVGGYAVHAAITLLTLFLMYRWRVATTAGRRVLTPMLVPALVWAIAYWAYLTFLRLAQQQIYSPPMHLYHLLIRTFVIALVLLPIAFAIGLTRTRARRSRLSDLVVELGDLPTPHHLENALKRALGDPSLQVGIWSREAQRYVGVAGGPLAPPGEKTRDTATTLIERGGEPLAVLVHDPALLDDPGLVTSVTAAARLAVENERLQEDVLAQLAEVHASRSRLVEAADTERRRIERNLHDGAQQRLVSLSLSLKLLETKLAETEDPLVRESMTRLREDLDVAVNELRELARGTYPAILADRGLIAAIESLTDRSHVPVSLDVKDLASGKRFDERLEATAYFVVAEGLTNIARYSSATAADVVVREHQDHLEVEVRDNGVGGASVSDSGSGLRGLADRVAAVSGELHVESPIGQGTRLIARIPARA